MTKCISFFILLLFSFSTLQAQVVIINEDFEDQDLTQNPEWFGDLANFSFFDDNGNTLLRLTAPDAGSSQLRTLSTTAYGSWEFFIDQYFPPSNSNRGYIFLVSDREDLNNNVNGYAIRTGESSLPNYFRLFRFTNGSSTEILTGELDISGGGAYQVKIERDEDGTWRLFESAGYGSEPQLAGSTTDNTFTESSHFGFQLNYTSTRVENFYFDDIIITNTENFDAISAEASSARSLDITFNYPVNEASLSTSGFQVDQGMGFPSSASLTSNFVVRLQFNIPFEDGNYTITINDVETDFGEFIDPNTLLGFSIQNPFTSTGAATISNSKIDLFFTEEVANAFIDPANFEISDEGNPDQVTQPEAGTIRLMFTTPLTSGEYTLSISNIQSVNGWSLVGNDSFDLFIFDEFEEGDLIISEFFYRVPIEWRTEEFNRPSYIELFSTSEKFLNLRDFTFNGESISSTDLPISPNEYLVVTRGEPIFLERFGERNFFEAENSPSLSLTTEDQIVVRSDNAVTVDSLSYRSNLWGGNGRSLERKSFNTSSIYSDNWRESEDALLGSPGLPNTVTIPTDPPEVTEITFPLPRELRIEFSRALSPESVQELSNFGLTNSAVFESTEYNIEDRKILIFNVEENLLDQIDYSFIYESVYDIFGNSISGNQEFNFKFLNPFRVLTGDAEGGNTVLVQFTQPLNVSTVSISNFQLSDGTNPTSIEFQNSENISLSFPDEFLIGSYTLLINDIESIVGWTIEDDTELDFYVFDEYEPRQVVINEILYRRLQAGSPEFVEIYNRSEQNIDLSEWTLSNASGSTTIPVGTSIRADDYLVFTDMESFAANSDKIQYLSGFQSLSNNGDAVVIKNRVETVIDSLFYLPTWGDNLPGISLERRDPNAISIDPANWTPSSAEGGSTPAAENSRYELDDTSPEIIFANLSHPDSLEVRFSEFINLDQSMNSQNKFNFASGEEFKTRFLVNGQETELLFYDPDRGNRIILDTQNLISGEEITLSIENFGDFQGNITSNQEQPVAQPVQAGDLAFNEVMYDPIRDNRENLTNQSEYIEIVNRRPYAISVEGIFLHDRPDNNDQVTAIRPVSSASKWISANGVLLFHAEDQTNIFTDSKTAVFFDLEGDLEKHALRINRTTLSLPMAGREVYLADSTRTTIDMIDYRPEWHNPNLINTRGKSLERVSPNGDTNDPANWSTNTQPIGGTPATQNSIFQESPGPLTETGISLGPNPFSPDGDGFDDNLFINYKFEEPDYLMRIRIYDRYGRLVRTLVDAHQAGFEGSVIWDGLTDNRQLNRIGIYIVYVEAYNSATGRNRNFRETAVLARQF